MTTARRNAKARSIGRGRPPLSKSNSAVLSSRATRSLIRSHHHLRKAHSKAVATGDENEAQALETQIKTKGGLSSYQLASTLGQSSERGGDSSRTLVEWLRSVFDEISTIARRLHMLEVGALSTENACSRVNCLDMRRIDLRSQGAGIEEIDFMELPVPNSAADRFDLISLSLVLNFVPDPTARGEMLRRIPLFFREPAPTIPENPLPCLFLVLPLPCVANSRYLTESKLQDILRSLGFKLQNTKKTSKLFYSLWRFDPGLSETTKLSFKKEELRAGGGRNNFAIILK